MSLPHPRRVLGDVNPDDATEGDPALTDDELAALRRIEANTEYRELLGRGLAEQLTAAAFGDPTTEDVHAIEDAVIRLQLASADCERLAQLSIALRGEGFSKEQVATRMWERILAVLDRPPSNVQP